MTIGLSYLPIAMAPVISEQKQTTSLRNQLTQQANERRGRELSQVHQVMSRSFEILNHSLSARAGLMDFSA